MKQCGREREWREKTSKGKIEKKGEENQRKELNSSKSEIRMKINEK